MRTSFRCDCGAVEFEKFIVQDEYYRVVECETCNSGYLITISRAEYLV